MILGFSGEWPQVFFNPTLEGLPHLPGLENGPGFDSQGSVNLITKYCFPNLHGIHDQALEVHRRYNTGFGIWDLPLKSSTKAKFGTLGLNWDFFGTIFIPFWDFYRYFHKNAAKRTKSKKGFKNRVVTTFNAELTLFGDHFWAFIRLY